MSHKVFYIDGKLLLFNWMSLPSVGEIGGVSICQHPVLEGSSRELRAICELAEINPMEACRAVRWLNPTAWGEANWGECSELLPMQLE